MANMNPPLIRELFRRIPLGSRCSATCPGWVTGPSGIARCDECWAWHKPMLRPSDADCARLPEAQQALRLAQRAMRAQG